MDTVTPPYVGFAPGQLSLVSGKPSPDPGQTGRVPPLRRLLQMVARRRWVLIGGLALGVLAGILLTLVMTPLYNATSRLQIARETARVVDIDSVDRDTSIGDQEFYQTQYGLLQTKVLAERVARTLGLVDNQAFFEMFEQADKSRGNRAERTEAAGKILLSHVGVAPVRGSSLVDITAVTPDPALSQRIAQAWGTEFIESTLERRFEASDYARAFLERRLEQLRGKLEQSERQAVGYAASQGIINLPSASDQPSDSMTGGRSLISDDLSALNAALGAATAERIHAQSRMAEARRPDASSEALGNDAITQLRQRRGELAADYAKMMIQFEPNYPPAQALSAQVRSLDSAIATEENRVRTSLQQGYRSALAREQALQARVSGLKGNLTDLRRRTIQYNIFQRDADTNRQLYNALLQRYKEIGVAGGIEKNNVAIVDPAKLPLAPSKPNLLLNLILATFAGGLLGLGAAATLEQVDEGLVDPAEIETKLGLPLLGSVPRVRDEDPLEALKNPKSGLLEAYLAVQANLELSTANGTPASLAVTSARAREGKSTTAVALAQSLARARRKVVLIDADMRAPSVHEVFAIPNDFGVSNILAGAGDIDRALHATDHEGLTVMAAGPQPPNAGDLLTGDRFPALIEQLRERFDHVIVDSPPVIGLADAPLVAAAVDSVLVVIEARTSQAGQVRLALGRLRAAQVNILGAVLTKFEAKRAQFGYGYDYGYGR